MRKQKQKTKKKKKTKEKEKVGGNWKFTVGPFHLKQIAGLQK